MGQSGRGGKMFGEGGEELSYNYNFPTFFSLCFEMFAVILITRHRQICTQILSVSPCNASLGD